MLGDSNDAVRLAGTLGPRQRGFHAPFGLLSDATSDTASGADVVQLTTQFSVRRSTTSPLLRVYGPLTGRTAPLLAAALDPLTRRGAAPGDVRVILAAVTEMTVAGAAPLLRAERRLRRAGCRLVLSQPNPIALALLCSTRLVRHFRIDPPPV